VALVETEKANSIMITGDAMGKPLVEALDDPGRLRPLLALRHHLVGRPVLGAGEGRVLPHLPNIIIIDAIGSSESGNNGMVTMGKDNTAMKSGPTVTALGQHRGVRRGPEAGGAGVGVIGKIARYGDIPVGYYNDPVKTAEVFIHVDGVRYVMPGDFATVEADGSITLLGRGSVSINSGGEKIFPEEVESAVRSHPEVFDAIVVGAPTSGGASGWPPSSSPGRTSTRPSRTSRPTAATPSPATRCPGSSTWSRPSCAPQRQARLPVGRRHRGRGARGDRQRGPAHGIGHRPVSPPRPAEALRGRSPVPVDLATWPPRAGRTGARC
jgi:acyl-CoA synthetase (AMP-forming)/AMP-acid ligase II